MNIKYDKKADAIYIRLSDKPYSNGKDLDDARRIDYDASGNPRGIELLCVSQGVMTDDLPERAAVEKMLQLKGIRILVP